MAVDPSDFMPPYLEHLAERVDNVRPLRAGKEEAKKPLFAVQMVGELPDAEDAPDWAIDEYIESDTLSLFFGDPEAGKSFGALSIALSMAAGKDWFGRAVKQGPVLYIAGEGRRGLRRRMKAWAIDNHVDLKALPLALSNMATALTETLAAAELLAVIADFKATHGTPVLVVFDTLARNFGPADENSTQDMTIAIATLDAVREATGAATLLVHHSGHGDKTRARGAMALKGALDSEYRFERDPTGLIRVECTKQKDAPHPPALAFELESVGLGYQDSKGREVTSAVLRAVGNAAAVAPESPSKRNRVGKGENQRRAMELLDAVIELQRRRLEQGGHDPRSCRVTEQDWRDAYLSQGGDRKRWHEVLKSLRDQGAVLIVGGYVQKQQEDPK